MIRRAALVVTAALTLTVATGGAALAAAPDPVLYPAPAGGAPVTDYSTLHLSTGGGDCAGATLATGNRPVGSQLPTAFDCKGSTKLTDYAAQPGDADYDPTVANNPQELYGRKGAGTNKAWETTTGRPDTVIAVTDSGIEWETRELVDKVALNRGELPPPCSTAGACDETRGDANGGYDANHDGIFSVRDYAGDPRVMAAVGSTVTARGYLTPEDLIRTFSDGVDHDGNGFVNDIAGWDFYQNDNDPADDVVYGHGTGEAKDSTAQVSTQLNSMSQCPNCRVLPLRVGDSFIADIDHFAAAVIYATDNGVSVLQEALGTLNHTAFAQTALDYAYAHGMLVVASEADEEAGHHNYPAALNHTMVVNSSTHFADQGTPGVAGLPGATVQNPKTYLALNGCTNWGGYTWVTVESNSCSSDATGQSSGIAGLLYSAARNAVQHGTLRAATDGAGRPLSSEEAKQLFRLAADDVDFSTPKPPYGPANNVATTLPDSTRYASVAGWDVFTGWGRLNAQKLVSLVGSDAVIPPEADVTSPAWWSPLGTSGTVEVDGHVAAPRAASYTYSLQVAGGVQPPTYPGTDSWVTVSTSGAKTAATDGKLGALDLAQVRSLVAAAAPFDAANDPTSTDLPEKDAFRIRVVVHATNADGSNPPDAIEQRQYFSYDDGTRLAGWPKNLGADVTAAAFADLTGDGVKETIVGDGNGYVHAFEADGSEAPGFPVHTDRLDYLPTTGTNAYASGAVSRDVWAPILLGSPAVADLDHDGYPEVSVTDTDGALYVFDHTGHLRSGFPVHDDLTYSRDKRCEDPPFTAACDHFVAHPVRDEINTVDRAFTAAPAIGDLDPAAKNGMELVVGSEDGHLYAWHANGSPVTGFPVLLRDPAKIASVDPVSHRVAFVSGANAHYGRQIITTPTIATVGGQPRIFVNTDEEYEETPNVSSRDVSLNALTQTGILTVGNTRVYSVYADGTAHPGTSRVANLGDNAYVSGWPHKIADLDLELLPDVGSGSDASPVVGTFAGRQVVATASIAGAVDLLDASTGAPVLGTDPQGLDITTTTEAQEFKSATVNDAPSVASLGGAVIGRLGGSTSNPAIAIGATGLRRLLDVALPDMQLAAQDEVDAYDPTTGTFLPGFPALMNDLQFFMTPAIADVDGSGLAAVIQSSAVYDTRAYKLGGVAPTGWPKSTSGWATQTAGIADVVTTGAGSGDAVQVVQPTREGNLFVWQTAGSACQTKEWPKYQHDERNSGDYDTDATPPAVLRDVTLSGTDLTVTASGDDDDCPAAATAYVVTVNGVQHVLTTAPAAAGTKQVLSLAGLYAPGDRVLVSAQDDAGNLGFPVVAAGDPAATLPDASLPVLLAVVGVVLLVVVRRRRRV